MCLYIELLHNVWCENCYCPFQIVSYAGVSLVEGRDDGALITLLRDVR